MDSEDTEAVSPGYTFFANGVLYPSGVMEEDHSRDSVFGLNLLYKAPRRGRHHLSVGGEATFIDLAESAIHGSFDPGAPGVLLFLPNAYPNPERVKNRSFFFQDDIQLARDYRMVVGARYDDHSVFGGTWSPRFGLIHRFNSRWTGKLLYGQAFRNPDFHEMGLNRNLRSETIRTTELQILGEPFPGWFTKVNLFVNHLCDRIESGQTVQDYRNIGHVTYDGLECEIRKRFGHGQEIFGNLSSFRLREESMPPNLPPRLPHNKVNVGYRASLAGYDTCLWGTFTARRFRNGSDPRPALPGLQLWNLTLQKHGFPGPGDRLLLRVQNLFNADSAFQPSYVPGAFVDFPQAGRCISLEMAWDL